jgi:hypothetical protein
LWWGREGEAEEPKEEREGRPVDEPREDRVEKEVEEEGEESV